MDFLFWTDRIQNVMCLNCDYEMIDHLDEAGNNTVSNNATNPEQSNRICSGPSI